jgi:rhodanese-related sulfurtransferase
MKRPRWIPLLAAVLPALAGCALLPPPADRPPYKKLSASVAFEMMRDSPEMLVLDLRPPQEFNGDTGHIRRARNLPLERLPQRLLEIDPFREETVLVYCRADGCGEQGAAILAASSFASVVLLAGGIDSWIRHGFKTVLPGAGAAQARPPADGKGPVRPLRPGEEAIAPRRETAVEPPPLLPRRDKSARNAPL